MDRLNGIFDSLGSFISAFFGLFLIGGIIFAVINIIRNSKKPKMKHFEQEYTQQFYQQPHSMPPYQYTPDPSQASKNSHTVAKVVTVALVLHFVIIPIVSIILILGTIFLFARGCNAERREQYERAISEVQLEAQSDLPETIDMGSSKLTFLFASEYDIEREVGECFAMANRPAENVYYGHSNGYLVLTDKEGRLITPEGEYYTNIAFSEDITYKGEGVIICTKSLSNGYYSPKSDEFEKSQNFYTSLGKEIAADKLEYDKDSFLGETKTNESRNLAETPTENDDYYYVETVGEIYVFDKFGKGDTAMPKALTDRKDELNKFSSKVIKKQGGEIVFPKNTKFDFFSEDYDVNFSLQGQTYSGDIYKQIYNFDIDRGYVSAVKYDKQSDTFTLGLFDLDGKAIYTSDLNVEPSNVNECHYDYSFRLGEYIAFKTGTGFDIINTRGEKVRAVTNADTIHALTDELFYSENSAVKQSFTLSSITRLDKDLTVSAKNGAYIDMISDKLICIAKDEVHSYYYLE